MFSSLGHCCEVLVTGATFVIARTRTVCNTTRHCRTGVVSVPIAPTLSLYPEVPGRLYSFAPANGSYESALRSVPVTCACRVEELQLRAPLRGPPELCLVLFLFNFRDFTHPRDSFPVSSLLVQRFTHSILAFRPLAPIQQIPTRQKVWRLRMVMLGSRR